MSTEDLIAKLDEHRASTAHLHAAMQNHLHGDASKLAACERLTQSHMATTDRFCDDAQVLVRPTGHPVHTP